MKLTFEYVGGSPFRSEWRVRLDGEEVGLVQTANPRPSEEGYRPSVARFERWLTEKGEVELP